MKKLGAPITCSRRRLGVCAFEALRCGGGAAVPPASAAALPGVGAALAPPSSVAFAAPVVQAVAVSVGASHLQLGGGSYAGVLGGAG